MNVYDRGSTYQIDLTANLKAALVFESQADVDKAFNDSGLNRDNMSVQWDDFIGFNASVYGPLGSFLGYLCEGES